MFSTEPEVTGRVMRIELFDIGSDPYEERNLAGEHPDKVRELSEMIAAEREQDGSSAREDVSSPMVT